MEKHKLRIPDYIQNYILKNTNKYRRDNFVDYIYKSKIEKITI